MSKILNQFNKLKLVLFNLSLLCCPGVTWAAGSQTLGNVASGITKAFEPITLLVTGGSYIAGLAFAVGAILKFKQHKENPTQVELGKPITFLLVAASLLFLPSILNVAGGTLFGTGASTAGPSGSVFSFSS